VAKAGFENAFREHWKLSPKAEAWVKELYQGVPSWAPETGFTLLAWFTKVRFNTGSNLLKKSPRVGKLGPRYFGLGPKFKARLSYSLGLNYF